MSDDCAPWCGIPEVNVWVGKPLEMFHIDGSLACFCSQACADAAKAAGKWVFEGREYSLPR